VDDKRPCLATFDQEVYFRSENISKETFLPDEQTTE
jgi:hypothetical protein